MSPTQRLFVWFSAVIAGCCYAELIQVQSVMRHGNQAPSGDLSTICPKLFPNVSYAVDAFGSTPSGLTSMGFGEMYDVGTFVKSLYVEELGFVKENYPPFANSWQFLSRNNLPFLESGASVAAGVFPPGSGPGSIPGRLQPVSVEASPEPFDTVLRLPDACAGLAASDVQKAQDRASAPGGLLEQYKKLVDAVSSACGYHFAAAANPTADLKAVTAAILRLQLQGVELDDVFSQGDLEQMARLEFSLVQAERLDSEQKQTYWAADMPLQLSLTMRRAAHLPLHPSFLEGDAQQQQQQQPKKKKKAAVKPSKAKVSAYIGGQEQLYAMAALLGVQFEHKGSSAVAEGSVPPGAALFFELHKDDAKDKSGDGDVEAKADTAAAAQPTADPAPTTSASASTPPSAPVAASAFAAAATAATHEQQQQEQQQQEQQQQKTVATEAEVDSAAAGYYVEVWYWAPGMSATPSARSRVQIPGCSGSGGGSDRCSLAGFEAAIGRHLAKTGGWKQVCSTGDAKKDEEPKQEQEQGHKAAEKLLSRVATLLSSPSLGPSAIPANHSQTHSDAGHAVSDAARAAAAAAVHAAEAAAAAAAAAAADSVAAARGVKATAATLEELMEAKEELLLLLKNQEAETQWLFSQLISGSKDDGKGKESPPPISSYAVPAVAASAAAPASASSGGGGGGEPGVSTCGPNPLGVQTVSYQPNPVVAGQDVVVEIEGVTSVAVGGDQGSATIHVGIEVWGITVGSMDLDLCSGLNIPCPLMPGDAFHGSISYPVSSLALPGIHFSAHIQVKDAKGGNLSCLVVAARTGRAHPPQSGSLRSAGVGDRISHLGQGRFEAVGWAACLAVVSVLGAWGLLIRTRGVATQEFVV